MVNYEPSDRAPVSTDDFVAIQRLVHRYADAVVHRDPEQWGSCWAEDAEWDLGHGRHVVGAPAIIALWTKAMAGMHAVVQTVDNGDAWYSVQSRDRAAGRWYITETYCRAAEGGGPGQAGVLRAHYDDTYALVDGSWRFTNRVLAPHYHGPPDLSAEFNNTAANMSARLNEQGPADA